MTGAMDSLVQLHHLSHGGDDVHTTSLNVHDDRVKAVEVEPMNPWNFWSASEDGTVRQFDTRALNDHDEPLIDLNTEIKSVCINPVRPYLIAVACGHEFIEVFDRRMIWQEAQMMLCPPHLDIGWRNRKKMNARRRGPFSSSIHTTCVSFGSTGKFLVGTWFNDHAYSFSLEGDGAVHKAFPNKIDGGAEVPGGDRAYYDSLVNRKVFIYDTEGGDPAAYTMAIHLLSKGLQKYPYSSLLLRARADALLLRKWKGDEAFALIDIEKALLSKPEDANFYFNLRVSQCEALHQLGQHQSASHLMEEVLKQFPKMRENIDNSGDKLGKLYQSLTAAMQRRKRLDQLDKESENSAGQTARPTTDDMDFTLQNEGEGEEEDDDDSQLSEDGEYESQSHPEFKEDDEEVLKAVLESSYSGLWLRDCSRPLHQRYIGQLNNQTDTKEVSFLGSDDAFVACGSDDGNVMLFSTDTGQMLHYLEADTDIVNCIQCHPHQPVLATSGLEHVVKLWQPGESMYPLYPHHNSRVFPSRFKFSHTIQMITRNQEINNESFVRPLFGGVNLASQWSRFEDLARRFGREIQQDDNGAISCPIV